MASSVRGDPPAPRRLLYWKTVRGAVVAGPEQWQYYVYTLAGVLLLTLAALVFRHAPARPLNRAMAYFLLLGGLLNGTWLADIFADELAPPTVFAFAQLFRFIHFLIPAAYLAMVAHAVPVGATSSLRDARVMLVLHAGSWLIGFLYLGTSLSPVNTLAENAGLVFIAAIIAGALSGAFGLAVAVVHLRRQAPGSPARARDAAYLLAFGLRDALWISLAVWLLLAVFVEERLYGPLEYVISLATLAYALLLGYGVLSNQILDIDMRLRFTIRQSTVAGVFVGVFLVVGTVASEYLVEQLGFLVGGVAAALLFLVIRPLGGLADRVAVSLVPNAAPLRTMPHAQKVLVFRDQAQLAWADGVMSARERDILDDARRRLGLDADLAADIERDVRASFGA